MMNLKTVIKNYQNFNKEFSKIKLPKKVTNAINLFSIILLIGTLIPICLFLLNAFKVFSVHRLNFLFNLLGAVVVFLLIYSYIEIAEIRYLRLLCKDDDFVSSVKELNDDLEINEIDTLINNINLKKYFLYIWLKSTVISLIGIVILYIVLRIFF